MSEPERVRLALRSFAARPGDGRRRGDQINEAIYAVYEGVGRAPDVDIAMKLGTNQPMGPLELADLIGLDTCLAIMEVMHRVLGDDKYRPCPLLKKYVDAGYLGRKTGRGLYVYENGALVTTATEQARDAESC